jgi:calcineurin-like phosphoesterase family protein
MAASFPHFLISLHFLSPLMRTFVVGDIHGCADPLRRLLERLRPRAGRGDSLVFLGDYISRGPFTREVVDLVLAERVRWPGPVVTLKGNHEAMMLGVLASRSVVAFFNWLDIMAGETTVLSYTDEVTLASFEASLPPAHRQFFELLKLWEEDANGIYVHAGIPPGRWPEECSSKDLLWIGKEFIESSYAWPKPVVFGHTPQNHGLPGREDELLGVPWRPLNRPEKIGIDTGCGLGGLLTAVILPEREFISEPEA